MNRQGWIAIAAAVVLVAVVGGIAYNAGVHQGILQSGKIVVAAPPPGGGPYPYPYPYYDHDHGCGQAAQERANDSGGR